VERFFLDWLLRSHPKEKMLFLAGPRQVGKTTLARQALERARGKGLYFNWDIPAHRRRILRGDDLLAAVRGQGRRPLVVFDELHKMRTFKFWLKGFYDENRDEIALWVTGSARLDLYQKGGDSLLGRYFLYRLHPLSLGEIVSARKGSGPMSPDACWRRFEENTSTVATAETTALLRFGGFPEPYLRQESTFHGRWLVSRRERITHDELRDLTRIQDLDRVEHLVDLLNPRIGSPLSINSLREDLEVAFETVRGWVASLERVYYVFGLRPFAKKIQRSLKRERKLYYWDWSEVRGEAPRFENFVVSHLKKACDVWTDFGLGSFEIWYLRDKEKREVDALITKDREPWLILEVKANETKVSPALQSFARTLGCRRVVQVVGAPDLHLRVKTDPGIVHVVSASRFLPHLP
jgi:predicted AAA+ superfamily ATPase